MLTKVRKYVPIMIGVMSMLNYATAAYYAHCNALVEASFAMLQAIFCLLVYMMVVKRD